MFQLHAEVTSVSPAVGSLVGGTVLSITGSGFPSLSALTSGTASAVVTAMGQPCAVITSNFSMLQCMLPAQVATPANASLPVGGKYPGMRGLWNEIMYHR